MKYKLIAADLDDTVLHSDHSVSDRLARAVSAYKKAGGRFVIATGRMYSGALNACRKLGLTGEIIAYQGCLVVDIESGRILETSPLPHDLTVRICDFAEERGLYFQLYENDTFIIERVTPYSERYAHFTSCSPKVAGIPLSKYARAHKTESVKVLLMTEPENVPALITEVNAHFGAEVLANTSKPYIVEIVTNRMNKGIAVARLAKKYGIPQEAVACIGDSMNDVPMLNWAGFAVVVENGSAVAKAEADLIVPSNNDDGAAIAVEKITLIS